MKEVILIKYSNGRIHLKPFATVLLSLKYFKPSFIFLYSCEYILVQRNTCNFKHLIFNNSLLTYVRPGADSKYSFEGYIRTLFCQESQWRFVDKGRGANKQNSKFVFIN